ncbi:Sec-independent protein translocase subunit TatA/TatB [Limnochorda pilosa]|uniref:Twin-arginine translocation protein, TatA/E family subunit n=1 Tax=Limnochorda pilosa TaxID=1555112 RepID=A0A0K2SIJ7_LIMPI|nr:twin-arginine translocase TatA/TatE family subunit [Limnochorda pilosa]BAS26915.1 twin-arginine translocation protein, TatA/E family subunit [Limnochorda pilosa]
MRLGPMELVVILVLVLLIVGPGKLPQLAKAAGEAIAGFRKQTDDLRKEIDETVEEVKKPSNPS